MFETQNYENKKSSGEICFNIKTIIGQFSGPQNRIFMDWASLGISYKLWDKNAIGGRRWNVAT